MLPFFPHHPPLRAWGTSSSPKRALGSSSFSCTSSTQHRAGMDTQSVKHCPSHGVSNPLSAQMPPSLQRGEPRHQLLWKRNFPFLRLTLHPQLQLLSRIYSWPSASIDVRASTAINTPLDIKHPLGINSHSSISKSSPSHLLPHLNPTAREMLELGMSCTGTLGWLGIQGRERGTELFLRAQGQRAAGRAVRHSEVLQPSLTWSCLLLQTWQSPSSSWPGTTTPRRGRASPSRWSSARRRYCCPAAPTGLLPAPASPGSAQRCSCATSGTSQPLHTWGSLFCTVEAGREGRNGQELQLLRHS